MVCPLWKFDAALVLEFEFEQLCNFAHFDSSLNIQHLMHRLAGLAVVVAGRALVLCGYILLGALVVAVRVLLWLGL